MTPGKAALIALAGTALLGAAPGGTLTVEVGNVRNANGNVHIDLCPEPLFLKDGCPWSANVPAVVGTTTIVVRGVPAGRYAVQAFHDENANHKIDRGLFGIPKEGYGFSRDAPTRLAPPKWADAVFAYNGEPTTIRLGMRYILGASGPPKSR